MRGYPVFAYSAVYTSAQDCATSTFCRKLHDPIWKAQNLVPVHVSCVWYLFEKKKQVIRMKPWHSFDSVPGTTQVPRPTETTFGEGS